MTLFGPWHQPRDGWINVFRSERMGYHYRGASTHETRDDAKQADIANKAIYRIRVKLKVQP